jgi:hypothetical protein
MIGLASSFLYVCYVLFFSLRYYSTLTCMASINKRQMSKCKTYFAFVWPPAKILYPQIGV